MISLSDSDKCRLREDVLSGNYGKASKRIPYGLAGETVTVISVHNEVAIVKAADGSRFPVPVTKLKKI